MKKPIVSVIITTHEGRKDRCRKAIESVLNQSYTLYEIIVVDDGSKDGTPAMVESFKDDRIVFVKRAENFGNDTRPKNEGILKAKGRYIAFLDSDNEYRKDHLQILVNTMNRENVDVVYGDRYIVYEDGQSPNSVGVKSNYNPFLLLQQNYIDTSDVLIKRQALYAVGGFDERYKKFVDWNLWVRMTKYGHNFIRVPNIITNYHIHKDMKSAREEDQIDWKTPAWNPYDCKIRLPHLGQVKAPRVAVYSITYDRLDFTKKCFKSLHKTAGYKLDHFVIDNGSTDGTKTFLKESDMFKQIILNEDNKGISIASNQIVSLIKEKKKYDIIIKVDNDALFKSDNWLKKMIEIWESNHRMVLSCYIEGLVHNPGGAPREAYGDLCGELIGMTKHIGGICHFVDARAYDHFAWDENSTLHGLQDLEFSNYLTSIGFQHGYLENYYCEHIYGTDEQAKLYPEYYERRKKEKMTKYNKEVTDVRNTSPDINSIEHWDSLYKQELQQDPNLRNDIFSFSLVTKELKDTGNLLDVGCGNGYLLGYIDIFKQSLDTYGVDISKEGLRVAKTRCKAQLKVGNILQLPYADNEFEQVVSTEVLEHIVEIKKAITEVARVTKKGGKLIAMFPYYDTVPSDEHVNFFTEKSVKALLKPHYTDIKISTHIHPTIRTYKTGVGEDSVLFLVTGVKA